jgi:hypothetical protein
MSEWRGLVKLELEEDFAIDGGESKTILVSTVIVMNVNFAKIARISVAAAPFTLNAVIVKLSVSNSTPGQSTVALDITQGYHAFDP